ncbi:MAG TPA: ferritin-like domain-containing protein [Solirubrobacterales bacterium]
MGRNRSLRGQYERRGICRAALLFLALLALLAPGCGKSGQGAETDPEKGSDAELLNAALAQELTLLEAYTNVPAPLAGRFGAVGRQFRAHEQEYVNAITKALRGLGGETEAEAAAIDRTRLESEDEFLALAYELENVALATYLDAAPRLFTDAPSTLAASLAAAHAQHLVVLRQELGATPAQAIPEAFESGEEPLLPAGR